MTQYYSGPERREYVRIDYTTPVNYKVCKEEVLSKLLQGYSVNLSNSGILCKIKDKVAVDDIVWISLDKSFLITCEEIEKRSLIYQSGIIGKVIRIEDKLDGTFEIGVKFLTREEKF